MVLAVPSRLLVFAVLLVVTELFVLSKLHVPVVVTVVFVPSRLPRDACDPLVLSRELPELSRRALAGLPLSPPPALPPIPALPLRSSSRVHGSENERFCTDAVCGTLPSASSTGLCAASAAVSGSFPSWAREGPFLEEAMAAETLLAADDAHR